MEEQQKIKLNLKDMAEEDRPREKLLNKGIDSLTNAELVAILIGSGNREETAVQLAQRILNKAEQNLHTLGQMTINELISDFKGIGEAKAISIVAAMELGRRRKIADVVQKKSISHVSEAAEVLMAEIGSLHHEEFWMIGLNQGFKILAIERVSQGGYTGVSVDIRMIVKRALELRATAIIVGHNHPSGNLEPSEKDIKLTNDLFMACNFLQINLLDHLIVSPNNYFSLKNAGII